MGRASGASHVIPTFKVLNNQSHSAMAHEAAREAEAAGDQIQLFTKRTKRARNALINQPGAQCASDRQLQAQPELPQAEQQLPERALGEASTSEPQAHDEDASFKDLGVSDWLCGVLASLGIARPTPVQRGCIPAVLAGRDVIGTAQTGSGKTAAFALPILQQLARDPYGVFALVLTPTRCGAREAGAGSGSVQELGGRRSACSSARGHAAASCPRNLHRHDPPAPCGPCAMRSTRHAADPCAMRAAAPPAGSSRCSWRSSSVPSAPA